MFSIKDSFEKADMSIKMHFVKKLVQQLKDKAEENQVDFNQLLAGCCKYALEKAEAKEK